MWFIMALQLAFALIILSKSYNSKKSERIDLVKIGLRASIIQILCIEAWSGVLILAIFVSVLTVFICLVRVYFLIYFQKAISFKIKSIIISRYILVYEKVLERLKFSKKSCSKLLLFSAFCK